MIIDKFIEEQIVVDVYDETYAESEIIDKLKNENFSAGMVSYETPQGEVLKDEIEEKKDEELFESVKNSMVKVNKRDKIKRAAGGGSLNMARQKNDPAYAQYMKYNALRKAYKEKLRKKYGSRAYVKARKDMM